MIRKLTFLFFSLFSYIKIRKISDFSAFCDANIFGPNKKSISVRYFSLLSVCVYRANKENDYKNASRLYLELQRLELFKLLPNEQRIFLLESAVFNKCISKTEFIKQIDNRLTKLERSKLEFVERYFFNENTGTREEAGLSSIEMSFYVRPLCYACFANYYHRIGNEKEFVRYGRLVEKAQGHVN